MSRKKGRKKKRKTEWKFEDRKIQAEQRKKKEKTKK